MRNILNLHTDIVFYFLSYFVFHLLLHINFDLDVFILCVVHKDFFVYLLDGACVAVGTVESPNPHCSHAVRADMLLDNLAVVLVFLFVGEALEAAHVFVVEGADLHFAPGCFQAAVIFA